MEENPFDAMLGAVRAQARGVLPAGPVLGKVISAAPLKVLAEGNTLARDRLLANPALLKDYKASARAEQPSGALAISAACGYGAHSGMTVSGGTLTADYFRLEDAWQAGDQLVLLPIEERQRYVILCKVVEL